MQKNISSMILIFFVTLLIIYPLYGMKKENEENNCVVCYMEDPKEALISLHGKPDTDLAKAHIVHLTCIERWRESTNDNAKKCPVCRIDVSDKTIEDPQFLHNSNNDKWKRVYSSLSVKSLILPTLSLTLPWLFDQDISREGLIKKGYLALGTYCLLTPYSTSKKFRWFSFERVKRIIGGTLICCLIDYKEDVGIGDSIMPGLIFSGIIEGLMTIGDKIPGKNVFFKTIDWHGCPFLGGYILGTALKKFLKSRNT
jgi:hypothetical protein